MADKSLKQIRNYQHQRGEEAQRIMAKNDHYSNRSLMKSGSFVGKWDDSVPPTEMHRQSPSDSNWEAEIKPPQRERIISHKELEKHIYQANQQQEERTSLEWQANDRPFASDTSEFTDLENRERQTDLQTSYNSNQSKMAQSLELLPRQRQFSPSLDLSSPRALALSCEPSFLARQYTQSVVLPPHPPQRISNLHSLPSRTLNALQPSNALDNRTKSNHKESFNHNDSRVTLRQAGLESKVKSKIPVLDQLESDHPEIQAAHQSHTKLPLGQINQELMLTESRSLTAATDKTESLTVHLSSDCNGSPKVICAAENSEASNHYDFPMIHVHLDTEQQDGVRVRLEVKDCGPGHPSPTNVHGPVTVKLTTDALGKVKVEFIVRTPGPNTDGNDCGTEPVHRSEAAAKSKILCSSIALEDVEDETSDSESESKAKCSSEDEEEKWSVFCDSLPPILQTEAASWPLSNALKDNQCSENDLPKEIAVLKETLSKNRLLANPQSFVT